MLRYGLGTCQKGITHFYLPSTRSCTHGMSHTCFTPQPQSVTALLLRLISRPLRIGGWVGIGGLVKHWVQGLCIVYYQFSAFSFIFKGFRTFIDLRFYTKFVVRWATIRTEYKIASSSPHTHWSVFYYSVIELHSNFNILFELLVELCSLTLYVVFFIALL